MTNNVNLNESLTEIFHELKNPIATIKLNVDLIKMENNKFNKNINVIENELTKVENIIARYLTFNTNKELSRDIVYFDDIISTIIDENTVTYPNISFNIFKQDNISILAFEYHIYMIFSNIIKNSIESIKDFGEINIYISEKEGIAQISICDTGEGISNSVSDKLKKGPYTSKKNGSGLGTVIIKNILNIYNGDFTLLNQEKGAKAIVTIPTW